MTNHKKYLERKALFKSFGYDVDKERLFIIKSALPIKGRILEAGTGKGHFAINLAKKGYHFTTFDVSKKEQKYARLNLRYFDLNHYADFRIENAEYLSFKDNSYDTIFCVNTIHHFKNAYKVLDELIRVISEEGQIILSDFTKEGFKVVEKIHRLEGGLHKAGKVTLSEAGKYMRKKGFRIKKSSSRFQEVIAAHRNKI